MIDLGFYTQLNRTEKQLVYIAMDDCSRVLKNGFIRVRKIGDSLDIRYYQKRQDVPERPKDTIYELKDGDIV